MILGIPTLYFLFILVALLVPGLMAITAALQTARDRVLARYAREAGR